MDFWVPLQGPGDLVQVWDVEAGLLKFGGGGVFALWLQDDNSAGTERNESRTCSARIGRSYKDSSD